MKITMTKKIIPTLLATIMSVSALTGTIMSTNADSQSGKGITLIKDNPLSSEELVNLPYKGSTGTIVNYIRTDYMKKGNNNYTRDYTCIVQPRGGICKSML